MRGRPVKQDDSIQPDFEKEPPKNWIKTTRRRDGVLYVAGHGAENPDVVFALPALMEEDAVEERYTSFSGDRTLKEPPQYFKGMNGSILKDLLDQVGIDATTVWYTSVIKWLQPRAKRTKPDRAAINYATPSFFDEIRKLKPKLVVCMGKVVFDLLCPIKVRADDIKLGIMYHKELDVYYVLVDPVHILSTRPDHVEHMRMDLEEVAKFVKQSRGIEVPKIPWGYKTLRNLAEVEAWVDNVAVNHHLFSVDCEWGDNNFVDGKLRYIQFAWSLSDAVVIRFMDDKGNYVFDVPYAEVGAVLGKHLNRPEVKYVGHHVSADFVWMKHWLNLEVYRKCVLDTEFAQQVLYEHVDLGLESLTMMYTDLGKYDLDLVLWKKSNPQPDRAGYAFIPEPILEPYAALDVIATFRIAFVLFQKLQEAGTWDYYRDIFNPFVTDIFTEFCYQGLPVDVELLDELREVYMFARDNLEKRFQESIRKEAHFLMAQELVRIEEEHKVGITPLDLYRWLVELKDNSEGYSMEEKTVTKGLIPAIAKKAADEIRDRLGPKLWPAFVPFLQHWWVSSNFNIRSGPAMKRWLFEVKRLTPVKCTANKAAGRSALPWEKVMAMPPDVRKDYQPATDKQTLQIYGETLNDPVIRELLDLNAVGNVLKAFLKPAEYDSDGELVRENGLRYWVASDNRIHPNYSTTESSRPRGWNPNALNLPKNVNRKISTSVKALLKELYEKGQLPKKLEKYLTAPIPSVRSVVTSPPGWCIVESDYKTVRSVYG